MDRFKKLDVRVFDKFIDKFADRYIKQRSAFVCGKDMEELASKVSSTDCGFDTDALLKIIMEQSIPIDPPRRSGSHPIPVKDIYRSDLGELLLTYYFEEKTEAGARFFIPVKNISVRERPDKPGRGIDAIGYRINDGKPNILLGEAKVSSEKKNPPSVVDEKPDSIYKTQKKYHDNKDIVLERLTDYLKRIPSSFVAFVAIAGVVVNMKSGKDNEYSVTYGCGLVRDYTCVDESRDFGKMKSCEDEFDPGTVDFVIFSFTEKTIEETVDLFYQKIQEKTR